MTIQSIADDIFAWLRDENPEWLKTAFIILNNTQKPRAELQNFLVPLIHGSDSPGTLELREKLGKEGLWAIERRTLPWSNIWGFMSVDLTFELYKLRMQQEGDQQ